MGLLLTLLVIIAFVWLVSAVIGGVDTIAPGGTLVAILLIVLVWYLLTRGY